jgi:predicted nucleotidyltransferase
MRLSPDQAEVIRQRIHQQMGARSKVWLFGSRADGQRRSGDVDLFVEPEFAPKLLDWLRCKSALADALDLKVDLTVQQPGRDLPIYRIARKTGWAL